MVFKTTSTNRKLWRSAGFTLVELMVALVIGVMLLAVCLSLSLYTSRSIASLTGTVDLSARSRHAIDYMSKKLRQASAVTSFSPTSVGVSFKGTSLTYTYDPDDRELVETDQGKKKVLLKDCDNLTFTLYKRAPIGSSFEQFPALNKLSEAKVIKVNWHCGRTLVGRESGSAEMASARIVLRAN
jgi:prepilin-type N-terminal cleavage/methylation domain-containing protein